VKHLTAMDNVECVGFYDIDEARATVISDKYNVKSYDSLEALLSDCDAVTIVTPTDTHFNVASDCLTAGKHVFIEKPITKSVAEAEQLLTLANTNEVLIQVGHIERLNPALVPLKNYSISPKYIEIQRLAPYDVRGTDVPVVLDKMIHDIDILLFLVNSEVESIDANGISILTDSIDIANARIRFKNGTIANLTSSRVAQDHVRKTKIFQQNLYITIDFLLGLTEIYRVLDPEEPDLDSIQDVQFHYGDKTKKIVYEKPDIPSFDALKAELNNFTNSVKGSATPIVDGQAGKNALELASNIHDLILEDLH
ncbi:MAG: Gfo/Idh/MocA family oxidoreductase, partial [Candidatus Neomarinimicrobiota bacterium]|nr:Gfo/Idh/MocA family oxidoreductase [Candidatus Neomarinimicrobiota bacterium]